MIDKLIIKEKILTTLYEEFLIILPENLERELKLKLLLIKLLSKSKVLRWGPKEQESLDRLKKTLSEALVLARPNWNNCADRCECIRDWSGTHAVR